MRRSSVAVRVLIVVTTLLFQSQQQQQVPLLASALAIPPNNNNMIPTTAGSGTSTSTITITDKTLGADTLKAMVCQASREDVKKALDVSGVLWLEHVNLVVGSRSLAEHFYLDLLGLSRDRSTTSLHCNLGQQQFHLAEAIPGQTIPQVVTGSIGLVVPSIASVRQRIQAALANNNNNNKKDDDDKLSFQQTRLEIVESDSTSTTLTVICPWGNRFHLYDANALDEPPQPTSATSSSKSPDASTPKMVQMHGPGGDYHVDRMTVRGQPGIRYIEVACPPGTTAAIARFYREMLSCTVTTWSSPTTNSNNNNNKNHDATPSIAVCVGPGVHVCFVEQDTITESDTTAMKGIHICIYVNDFQALYQRLQERYLIWTNPRFLHLDSCDTWDEAMSSRTLRFKDILDLNTGQKILELEHETRPLRHGQYLKVPFYEPK